MRLATYVALSESGAPPRLAALRPDGALLDVGAEARERGVALPFEPGDMISLLASGASGREAVAALLAAPRSAAVPLDGVRLLAPIHRPRRNVFCVGWNYLEHFAEGERWRETKQELPAHPVFFTKATTAVNGPFDPIPYDPRVTAQLDWEAELGVVIGPGGRDLSEAEAMDHVYGYLVVNDVSARDVQKAHGGQWMRGKSLDGTCPMGPFLVTADEVDPSDLRISCRVNGVAKQESSTRHLYFQIPRLLAELSLGLTLEAGDVVSTGTPPGVGFGRTPPEFLAPGDLLETEIQGLGTLRNRIAG